MIETIFTRQITQARPRSTILATFSIEHHDGWGDDLDIAVIKILNKTRKRTKLMWTRGGALSIVQDVPNFLKSVDVVDYSGQETKVLDSLVVTILIT